MGRHRCDVVFIGQSVERKGLPVLLRAFEALREHVPARLTLIGAEPEDVEALVLDDRGIAVLGKVDDEAKHAALAAADVLCAPSLGGESFGMVLTEAFAQGKPVVASAIPGYTDVVRDGVDGVLVPRGDATALAQALLDLAYEPGRRATLAASAAQRAERYAWPQVAREVLNAYEDAIATPAPGDRAPSRRRVVRRCCRPTGARATRRAACRASSRRSPSPHARGARGCAGARSRWRRSAASGSARLALEQHRDPPDRPVADRSRAPTWVLVALALMCFSMVLRSAGWHAILQRGAARGPRALRRRVPGDVDRRADVGHAARPPR